MATAVEWSNGYARQARADFETFELVQPLAVPDCHKLQFLQMACEKLVKAHLCGTGTDPAALQSSHTRVAGTLPVILRQYATSVGYTGRSARGVMATAKKRAAEIECLAPAVKRGGQRPDNCEYPWKTTRAACTYRSIGRLPWPN
jgi:hypothetical protein